MSESYIQPTTKSLSALLGMIYGDDLSATETEASTVSALRVATFINDDDRLVAACLCDREFVVYAGAALSMIPAVGAQDMIAEGSVSDTIAANFHEIMNICTRLLMSDQSAHLRLDKTLECAQQDDLAGSLEALATRLGFEVEIPGYGKGALAIYMN